MSRLLLLLLTAGFLFSCGYGSRYEAEKACWDWVEDGGTITKYGDNSYRRRRCKEDSATRKFISFQNMAVKKGGIYGSKNKYIVDEKVIKRFKY